MMQPNRLGALIAAALATAACSDSSTPGDSTGSTAIDCTPRTVNVPLAGADAGAGDASPGGDAAVADAASDAGLCGVCPTAPPSGNAFLYQLSGCAPVTTDAGAMVACNYVNLCPGGRATDGALAATPASRSAGDLFAAMASLETGSVAAFRRLVAELRAHRAPRALQKSAQRAVRDERLHARGMQRLAARYGASTGPAARGRLPVRTLFAVAVENAVEGCVRETWGAALAAWQAEHARDRAVRDVFRDVARDELAHARLAWRIAAWAEARLAPDDRDAVRAQRARAVRQLRDDVLAGGVDDRAAEVGWPPAGARAALWDTLTDTVWAAA